MFNSFSVLISDKDTKNSYHQNQNSPPPNFDKDYYKAIGVNPTPEELRFKNPSNYVIKKTLQPNPNKKYRKGNKKKK